MKLSDNPTSESRRGLEYELGSLMIGARFRINSIALGHLPGHPPTYGTLLTITQARCTARMRGGEVRSLPLELAVELLPPDTESDSDTQPEEATTMATKNGTTTAKSTTPATTTPAARALTAKWKLALAKLSGLLKVDTATDVVKAQREVVLGLYGQAVVAQIPLPTADFADPVFTDMDLAGGAPAAGNGAAAKEDTTAAPGDTKKKPAKTAKVKAEKAPKAAKAPKGPKVIKEKKLSPCHDGCGTPVAGRFRQGHDARYRSLILQVEREELVAEKLPAYMRNKGGRDNQPLAFKKVADGFKCTNSILAH